MRFKLVDCSVLEDKIKKEVAVREAKKEPFLLWGVVNTRWTRTGKDGKATADPVAVQYPHMAIQTLRAGIRVADVKEYQDKGFILLHFYFPKQEDLPTLRKEGIVSESGWRLELRNDASYFNDARQYCEQLKNSAINPLQSVVNDQAKELEELRALHAKGVKLNEKPGTGFSK